MNDQEIQKVINEAIARSPVHEYIIGKFETVVGSDFPFNQVTFRFAFYRRYSMDIGVPLEDVITDICNLNIKQMEKSLSEAYHKTLTPTGIRYHGMEIYLDPYQPENTIVVGPHDLHSMITLQNIEDMKYIGAIK